MEKQLNWHLWVKFSIVVVGLSYHVLQNIFVFQSTPAFLNLHVGFCLVMILWEELRKNVNKIVVVILLIAGVLSFSYVHYGFDRLEMSLGFLEPLDLIIGLIYIIVVLEATRRAWGIIFPIISSIAVLYFFFGHYVPGVFRHHKIYYEDVVSRLSLGFSGSSGWSGLFNQTTNASANFVIFFALLAGVFMAIRMEKLFYEVGKLSGRVLAGGPGQTAVIGSSLLGAVTGVGVANVVMSGSFTIPMMKQSGYSVERAAGIEGAASTGAQMVPPSWGRPPS